MLSEQALRRIGAVDRDLIEKRIRTLFDRWARGDIEGVIACLAPDVAFPSFGFWTGMSSPVYGREQVAKMLRQYSDAFENIVSVLHEIVIDGDRAVVHRTAVGRMRESGQRYQCDEIDFFRFRDGLVVEYSTYPDAAAWSNIALSA